VLSHEEIEEQVFMASIGQGALVTKGSWFYADEGFREQDCMFFRATFAAAPFEKIDLAIQRFGAAVREVFGLGVGAQNGHEEPSGLEVSKQNAFQQVPQNGVQDCNGHA
jgi:hypothetical protein